MESPDDAPNVIHFSEDEKQRIISLWIKKHKSGITGPEKQLRLSERLASNLPAVGGTIFHFKICS